MSQKSNLQLQYRKRLAKSYSELHVRENHGMRTKEERESVEIFLKELNALVAEHNSLKKAA